MNVMLREFGLDNLDGLDILDDAEQDKIKTVLCLTVGIPFIVQIVQCVQSVQVVQPEFV